MKLTPELLRSKFDQAVAQGRAKFEAVLESQGFLDALGEDNAARPAALTEQDFEKPAPQRQGDPIVAPPVSEVPPAPIVPQAAEQRGQVEQPAPIPTGGPAIIDLVVVDLMKRKSVGVSRYGTPLQAGNGRDALQDAYEEALDLAAYLRQALEERDEARRFAAPR